MEESEKLPLEILRDKYIPLKDMKEKYNVSLYKVQDLIESKKIRYAEFRAPGDTRRSVHVNPEDVFRALGKEMPHEITT